MGQVIINIKLAIVWLYNGVVGYLANAGVSLLDNTFTKAIIVAILFFIFLPEIMFMVSPWFRSWVKEGVEDADGQMNKSDLKDAAINYVAIWSMRVFMGFSVAKAMGYGQDITVAVYYAPLIASFGTAGLSVFKRALKRVIR